MKVSLQCSCNWQLKVNKGKTDNGTIAWEKVQLRRQKRTWYVPPVLLREEQDNTPKNPIAKVHSDLQEVKANLMYTMTGQGVDMPPYGVFVLDPRNGNLNVTKVIIDREMFSMLYLTVFCRTTSGQNVEKPLELRVKIQDINDNPPIFQQSTFMGSVEERSKANTLVMQMFASDADEEGSINAQIAYKILSQNPAHPPMFIMNQFTGQVFTMSDYLDREQFSSYSLVVSGTDLNGAAEGLSGQCGSEIRILDVNDNIPTLEFDSYNVQIIENWIGETGLRIRAFDLDEMYSDNWIANFEFTSGNEGGWFVIETDTQTNEGVLRVVKALDYETMQTLQLGFIVTNRAAFHSSIVSEYRAQMTSIAVQVQNVVEGPSFQPSVVNIVVPQGLYGESLYAYVLTKMYAIDLDTGKPATNVRYTIKDILNWLTIDSTTGEIRLVHDISRDTGGIGEGTHTATIFAESPELPNRPANATVVITMPRANDNCPVITTETRLICTTNMRVIVQAYDNDSAPFGVPFTFTFQPAENDWTIERVNDTSVAIVGKTGTGPRNITLYVVIRDNANRSCPNPFPLKLQICECTLNGACDSTRTSKSIALSPAAIGLMVLGFLALLLALLLLLLCLCGAGAASTFVPVGEGYEGACHAWGTEGAKPEDVDLTTSLITAGGPNYTDVFTTNTMVGTGAAIGALGAGGLAACRQTGMSTGGADIGYEEKTFIEEATGGSNMDGSFGGVLYQKSGPINMAYIENYFAEKAEAYGNEDESRPANDCLLIYDNEGIGSLAGSVGCCSFIADDMDEDYLENLGPKFRTLAEICSGKEIGPLLTGEEPKVFVNVPVVEVDTNTWAESSSLVASGRSTLANPPVPVSSTTYLSESAYSSSTLQPARPMHDAYIPGNMVVTETYTTTGTALKPVEPRHQPGIVVTERVVRPSSVIHDVPTGSNMIVTERVMRPVSVAHELLDFPSLGNSSDVVLTERVLAPSNARMSTALSYQDLSEAQNVVVTERVIQPATNIQGNYSLHPDMGGGKNIYVTEKTVRSGSGIQNMLSTEPLLTQTIGSTSPSITRSKVTKYSTMEYTKK
uniref:Cadherin domain-containing protein n=1 Tax=Leptobrachium leishanense TaxID=445787 RepID=A0A8C5MF71_9ANUR